MPGIKVRPYFPGAPQGGFADAILTAVDNGGGAPESSFSTARGPRGPYVPPPGTVPQQGLFNIIRWYNGFDRSPDTGMYTGRSVAGSLNPDTGVFIDRADGRRGTSPSVAGSLNPDVRWTPSTSPAGGGAPPAGLFANAPQPAGGGRESLDLPPDIQEVLQIPSPISTVNPGAIKPLELDKEAPSTFAGFRGSSPTTIPPSYEAGGMVGPGGMPVRPNAAPKQMSPQEIEANVQAIAQQNPDGVKRVQAAVQGAVQAGELTPQELNMVAQLATVAVQNPDMYPQLRQYAIQQGLGTEQTIPEQYDQGFLFVILFATRAAQGAPNSMSMVGGGQPAAASQSPVASMRRGGALPDKSRNPDGSVPIVAHEGEYVVPKAVVAKKGTEFFDKLVERYSSGGKAKA